MSPSQTEIAKACAVVDTAGMVMVKEEESQEVQGVSRGHQEPGETSDPDNSHLLSIISHGRAQYWVPGGAESGNLHLTENISLTCFTFWLHPGGLAAADICTIPVLLFTVYCPQVKCVRHQSRGGVGHLVIIQYSNSCLCSKKKLNIFWKCLKMWAWLLALIFYYHLKNV